MNTLFQTWHHFCLSFTSWHWSEISEGVAKIKLPPRTAENARSASFSTFQTRQQNYRRWGTGFWLSVQPWIVKRASWRRSVATCTPTSSKHSEMNMAHPTTPTSTLFNSPAMAACFWCLGTFQSSTTKMAHRLHQHRILPRPRNANSWMNNFQQK